MPTECRDGGACLVGNLNRCQCEIDKLMRKPAAIHSACSRMPIAMVCLLALVLFFAVSSKMSTNILANLATIEYSHLRMRADTPSQTSPRLLATQELFELASENGNGHVGTWRGLSGVHALAGDYDSARAVLEEAEWIFPYDALIHVDLGQVLIYVGQDEQATQVWRRAGAYNQLFSLAEQRMRDGKWDEAMRFLLAATAVNPKKDFGYRELGYAHWKLGHMDEAREALQRAVDLNPLSIDNHYLLTMIYLQKRQYDDALVSAENIVVVAPQNYRGYATMGEVLIAQNRLADAIAMYRLALALEPSQGGSHAGLGIAYLRSGDLTLAREELEAAVRLQANVYWYHSHLGETYRQLGLLDWARREFEYAVSLNETDTWANESLQKLR